jgi:putative thiamine transport system ATP-binding protein
MLELRSITLDLAGRRLVTLDQLSIAAGETLTLIGPSGAGKSSLLSFIGGDLDPAFAASGTIVLNGKNLDRVAPERRAIGRLFQDDLLFPHMTVGENLGFGLRDKHQRGSLIAQALRDAGLEGFGHRAPQTLSGGQRARVALMRALLAEPEALVLDEPFNRLDEELRDTIRRFTFDHIRARNIPALLVSHSLADAPQHGRVIKLNSTGTLLHV